MVISEIFLAYFNVIHLLTTSFISKHFYAISLFLVLPYLIIQSLASLWERYWKQNWKQSLNFYLCCISLQWEADNVFITRFVSLNWILKMASFELGGEMKNTFYLVTSVRQRKSCETDGLRLDSLWLFRMSSSWQDEKHSSFRLVKWKTFLSAVFACIPNHN